MNPQTHDGARPADAAASAGHSPAAAGARGHNNYDVFEVIGRGPRSVVYAGYNQMTKRKVAIKEAASPGDPDQARSLQDTARFLAELPDYDHVIEVKDLIPENGWLVLDRMRESLADWQAREKKAMPPDLARSVLRQALKGLAVVHAAGRWVGNVKPSNLLINDDGRVKIADSPGLVADGVVRPPDGVPKYLAPERVDSSYGEVGPGTDLYGLGFTTLELLAGPRFDASFAGTGPDALDPAAGWLRVHGSRAEHTPPAAKLVPGLPGDLARVIDRLVLKDVGKRYPTAEAALEDLAAGEPDIPAAGGAVDAARRPAGARRRKKRWPVYAAAGVCAAGLAVAAAALLGGGADETVRVTIETTPAGARVTLLDPDKEMAKPTPEAFRMFARPRRARVEKDGFEPETIDLDPAAATTYRVALRPAPAPPEGSKGGQPGGPKGEPKASPTGGPTGEPKADPPPADVAVRIVTRPGAGYAVRVGGKPVPGTTPVEVRLPPGRHTVAASKDGHAVVADIDVRPGGDREFTLDLPPPAVPVAPPPAEDPKLAADLKACEELIRTGGRLADYLAKEAPGNAPRWQRGAAAGSPPGQTLLGHALSEGVGVPRNEAEAVQWYQKAAAAGQPAAMYALGLMYLHGRGGLPKDEAAAADWFGRAADLGHAAGMYNIGVLVLTGRGGRPRDEAGAVKWFHRSGDLGHPAAMNNLGVLREQGRGGLAKDEAGAIDLYRKAAALGNREAMTNLGVALQRGGGVKDDAEAVGLFRKAAALGDPSAAYNLGLAHAGGRGGLVKDDAEAVGWFRRAADHGNPAAMTNLGVMYEHGRGGLGKNDGEAVKLYQRAADLDHPAGLYNLGVMHQKGLGGLPKSDGNAGKAYRRAADLNNREAAYSLGVLLEKGSGGCPPDPAEAAALFRKAADAGHPGAMTNLGVMYAGGAGGLPKDEAAAVQLFRKAADAGNPAAMYNLGLMYDQGLGGLEKSDAAAVPLFRKAADLGDSSAMNNLATAHLRGAGGLPKDEAAAVQLFRKAADAGNPAAMYNLGLMYDAGRGGLGKDKAEAVKLFRKAADLGHKDASKRVPEEVPQPRDGKGLPVPSPKDVKTKAGQARTPLCLHTEASCPVPGGG